MVANIILIASGRQDPPSGSPPQGDLGGVTHITDLSSIYPGVTRHQLNPATDQSPAHGINSVSCYRWRQGGTGVYKVQPRRPVGHRHLQGLGR
ncbi:hypothetical protein RRG08_039702 [Elysia crispata]|uniref:Uncharacterized protein n=1 Tax=Elysia crispata TaxID=231223 RepID=A0AAE1CV73_9GAST|nr:hypothetical protein RRG08_039702 [Elysia crispata]